MSNKKDGAKKEGAVALLEKDEDAGLVKGDDGLTDRQRAFVEAFVGGTFAGNGTKSAEAAGYSEKSAATIGSLVQKLPHVSAAIDARLREEIGVNLTAQAVSVIRKIINDPDAPLKLKGDMAAKVIEYSGLIDRTKAQKAKETGLGADKVLTEYTRTELEDIVRIGAAVLQAAAALPGPGQAIDGRILPLNVHDSVTVESEEVG